VWPDILLPELREPIDDTPVGTASNT
jgi:hypothetical protein